MNTKLRQFFIFFIGLGVSIGLDQFTKHLAVVHLKGQKPFVLIKGVFEFYYSENRGAAFGMLQGRQGFFFLIAAAVILAVLWAVYRMPAGRRYLPLMCSLFLLVSGAVGNMIDRLTQKYVVDFLYFKLIDFPIFNVADCYVGDRDFLADPSVFLLLIRMRNWNFFLLKVRKRSRGDDAGISGSRRGGWNPHR